MGEAEPGRREGAEEQATVTLSPSAELPAVGQEGLAALHEVGRQWPAAPPVPELPLDPTLGRYRAPAPGRFSRLAPIEMFRAEAPDELVTTGPDAPSSAVGRARTRLRRAVLGPPLNSAAVVQERMRKLIALPVLASDLLSSVAYGPEAMLSVLVLAGSAALRLSLPVAGALVVLMVAVGMSYRQTIRAYPHGAGSYLVASDNLGPRAGLAAAAGLLMDYVLTVSVSVASGVDAIASAVPRLAPLAVPLGVAVIAALVAGNLRGVRASGRLFAAPTYAFLLAVLLLLAAGLTHAARRGFTPVPPPAVHPVEGLGLLLVLRAFASGATSMTGIEAVSNAIPVFKPVEWRHARTTLTWMLTLLVVMFTGLVVLIHLDGVVPKADQTMLSQLGRLTLHSGPWYGYLQATTALVLLLAANTSFSDFPRLLFFIARDGYAPHVFLRMGDRLVFSNGILALALAATVILVAFHGRTQALIPLYAVGVFLAFTLSQAGMVRHWLRRRGPHWRKSMALNGTGALLSGLVLVTAAVTKFTAGAWLVVVAVPSMVLLSLGIRRHYDTARAALAPHPLLAGTPPPNRPEVPEREPDSPAEVRHLSVVPVARLNLAALRALAYAASLRQPVCAVHISPDDEEDERFRCQWDAWGNHLRLEIVVSPYRAVIPSLTRYIEALHLLRPDVTLTVILPEIVVRHWWQQVLHSRTPNRLRRALRSHPGIVVTSVPFHLSP